MKSNLYLLAILLIILIAACTKGLEPDNTSEPTTTLPIIIIADIVDIRETSSISGGNVISDGNATITEKGVCWSNSQFPTVNNSRTSDGSGIGSFLSNITGLIGNTSYYVRAYAINSEGTAYSSMKQFTTAGSGGGGTTGGTTGIPTITTTDISSITANTAISGGDISNDGNSTVTERGLCWSSSQDPTISDSKSSDGSGKGQFTSTLTGLSASTIYYVKAYATNSEGTAYGGQKQFETPFDGSPITDNRDGKSYKIELIGNQVWFAENLAYLPSVSYSNNGSYTDSYYYVYDYQGSNVNEAKATYNYKTYGVLYNWTAAMTRDSASITNQDVLQGACPDGWHLPSDTEWKQLEMYLGMSQSEADKEGYRGTNEGKKLKSSTGWSNIGTGINSVGFKALPGGALNQNGDFRTLNANSYFWSSSEFETGNAWSRVLGDYDDIYRNYNHNSNGLSVRCIKN